MLILLGKNDLKTLFMLFINNYRTSHPKVFSKYAPNLQENKNAEVCFQITLWHGWSSVNLLYTFRTPFPKKHL